MKIRADINEILYNTDRIRLDRFYNNTGHIRGLNKSITRNQQSISADLIRQKELIDAIIISQRAHSYIQKALEISSRLKDAANITLNSGKIQNEEFSDNLSNIQTSLKQVNEDYKSAVEKSRNKNNGTSNHNNDTALPLIQNEISSLREAALNLDSGKRPVHDINIISNTLKKKASVLNNVINNFMKSMTKIPEDLFTPNTDYSNLVEATGQDIVSNPDSALITQGNINYKTLQNTF